jgi:hypothetical protein
VVLAGFANKKGPPHTGGGRLRSPMMGVPKERAMWRAAFLSILVFQEPPSNSPATCTADHLSSEACAQSRAYPPTSMCVENGRMQCILGKVGKQGC